MDFKKYKDCYIKLINVNNMSEIYGILIDSDTKGNLCLKRSIISANRMVIDPATIFNKIIKYTYTEQEGSTISSILGPMYNNDKGDSIVWLNLQNYIFVPIHDNSSDISEDAEKSRDLIMKWIDNVYTNYSEMYELLDASINEEELEENEKDNGDKDDK